MAPRQVKQIDYESLTSNDLVLLVHAGDNRAFEILCLSILPVAERIARNYARRYTWLDHEDIRQETLLAIHRIIKGFRPGKGASLEKYVYHRITYEVKDVLRCEDPLGISWPQKGKGHYPEWHRLGDEAFKSFDVEGRSEMEFDQRELLGLYESIDEWRLVFLDQSDQREKRDRVVLRRDRFPDADLESQFIAWTCEIGFWGQRVKCKKKPKSQAKSLSMLAEWRKSRLKPKQLCFF
jgi:DNA-directed RNA polymerase specialized sigma subunit